MMAGMHAMLAPASAAPILRRWHRGCLATLAGIALFAGGCAELPAQVERPASKAWAAPENTSLGNLAQSSRQNAGSGNASRGYITGSNARSLQVSFRLNF